MIKFATQTLTARRFRTFCFSGTNLARKIHPRRTLEGDPARQIPCHKTLRKNPARGIHPRKTFSSALAHQIHSQKTLATNPVCIFSQKFPLERICHAKFLLPKLCERILSAKFLATERWQQICCARFLAIKLCEKICRAKFAATKARNEKNCENLLVKNPNRHKKGATRAECDPRFAPVK